LPWDPSHRVFFCGCEARAWLSFENICAIITQV
jgi:hypothetical protein